MDADENQLYSLEQQYNEVEKEAQNLAEELKNSRKRRRQLEAEVRFLQGKVKFFTKKSSQENQVRPASVDGRPGSSRERLEQRPAAKTEEAPRYYEVEVKFMDTKAMGNGNGFMDSAAMMHYSSLPQHR